MAELIDRTELLTREEAIKALNEYGTLFPSDKSEAIDMAIMAIEALEEPPRPIDPTIEVDLESGVVPRSACEPKGPKMIIYADRPRGEWIPVSERLPDIEQDVLATTTLFGIREVTFAWRINDSEWLIREGSREATSNDILAWMPLPEAYKESDTK